MTTLGMTRAQLERRYTELLLAAFRAELRRRRARRAARHQVRPYRPDARDPIRDANIAASTVLSRRAPCHD